MTHVDHGWRHAPKAQGGTDPIPGASGGPSLFGANAGPTLNLDTWPSNAELNFTEFATNDPTSFELDGSGDFVKILRDGFYAIFSRFNPQAIAGIGSGIIATQIRITDAADTSIYEGIMLGEALPSLSSYYVSDGSAFPQHLTGVGFWNFDDLAAGEYPLRVELELDTSVTDTSQGVLYGLTGIRFDQITDALGAISNI